jgi:hypothetical protein
VLRYIIAYQCWYHYHHQQWALQEWHLYPASKKLSVLRYIITYQCWYHYHHQQWAPQAWHLSCSWRSSLSVSERRIDTGTLNWPLAFCTGRAIYIGWSKTLQVATSQFLHCSSWIWWVWVWLQWVTSICHINILHCVTPSHVQAHCLIPLPERCYHKSTNENDPSWITMYHCLPHSCNRLSIPPSDFQDIKMGICRCLLAISFVAHHLQSHSSLPNLQDLRMEALSLILWCLMNFNVHGCWRRWNNGSKSEMQAHSWSEWSLLLLFL